MADYCNKCIHEDVCYSAIMYEDIETICDDFKDKSKFIEMPCRLGEKMFFSFRGEICDATVVKIELNRYTCPSIWLYWEFTSTIMGTHTFKEKAKSAIGRELFFTREEAEQALKEMVGADNEK